MLIHLWSDIILNYNAHFYIFYYEFCLLRLFKYIYVCDNLINIQFVNVEIIWYMADD